MHPAISIETSSTKSPYLLGLIQEFNRLCLRKPGTPIAFYRSYMSSLKELLWKMLLFQKYSLSTLPLLTVRSYAPGTKCILTWPYDQLENYELAAPSGFKGSRPVPFMLLNVSWREPSSCKKSNWCSKREPTRSIWLCLYPLVFESVGKTYL